MPKTRVTLDKLRKAFEQWLGQPTTVKQFQRPENDDDVPTSLNILFFQPSNLNELSDEEVFTYLVTEGTSTRRMKGPLPQVELSLRVDGRQDAQQLDTLARWLAEFAIIPFREGRHLAPDLVVQDVKLPLFEKMEALLVTHWNVHSEKQLPGIKPPVVVLRLVPLYASEVDIARDVGAAEVVRRFLNEGINRHRPGRQAASLDPLPETESETGEPAQVADDLPSAVVKLWQDVAAWLQKNAPERYEELKEGATAADIDRLETETGRVLPEDYRASLQAHNGEVSLHSYRYLPIEELLDIWQRMQQLKQKGAFSEVEPLYNQEAKLQEAWWHVGWIPFAADSGGNLLCVDTAPGPNGTFGQILFWEKVDGPVLSEHMSFLVWLQNYRDDLYHGKYTVDNQGFLEKK